MRSETAAGIFRKRVFLAPKRVNLDREPRVSITSGTSKTFEWFPLLIVENSCPYQRKPCEAAYPSKFMRRRREWKSGYRSANYQRFRYNLGQHLDEPGIELLLPR
jgi:hypothetical protein